MKAWTLLVYLAMVAIVIMIILTVTSGGRIGWDESILIIVPLALLAMALAYARRRSTRAPS